MDTGVTNGTVHDLVKQELEEMLATVSTARALSISTLNIALVMTKMGAILHLMLSLVFILSLQHPLAL